MGPGRALRALEGGLRPKGGAFRSLKEALEVAFPGLEGALRPLGEATWNDLCGIEGGNSSIIHAFANIVLAARSINSAIGVWPMDGEWLCLKRAYRMNFYGGRNKTR